MSIEECVRKHRVEKLALSQDLSCGKRSNLHVCLFDMNFCMFSFGLLIAS